MVIRKKYGRQFSDAVKGLPYIQNLAASVDSISFFYVSSTIICFDDLERRGAGLILKDVMGLVSLLKEQKQCKVVLLFNDGEKGLEEYDKSTKVLHQHLFKVW